MSNKITLEIGDEVIFDDQLGNQLMGVIYGREWVFETLFAYMVEVSGVRYSVNANNFVSGHPF